MPRPKPPGPDDDELVVRELKMLAPMGLTKLDLAEELNLPNGHVTTLLKQLVKEGRIKTKTSDRNHQNKLFYVDS